MKQRILPFLLVVVSILAYTGLLARGDLEFVYDDNRFVRDNLAIRDLRALPYYFTNPSTVDPRAWSGIYRPIRTLDFAIDFAITGTTETTGSVRWFHVRSILYHAMGTLLVFVLFSRWGAGRRWAALGALFFALNPIQTESVAWITSRADVLCLVLFLAALYFHSRSRGFDRYFGGALGFLGLALLSKEAAIMFAAAAILTDFVFRDGRRLGVTLRRWPVYLVYSVMIGAYIFLWINRQRVHQAEVWEVGPLVREMFPGQLLTMARGFIYYARLIVFPVDLAQDYYLPEIGSLDVLTGICAVLVLGTLAWSVRTILRTGSAFAFAVLWFFITIFPTSNLVVPIGIPTTERFAYLPMVGVAFWVGSLLRRVTDRGAPGRVLVGVMFSCLFLLTFVRAQVWSHADALWASTLSYDSPRGVEWFADRGRVKAEELQREEAKLRDLGKLSEANRLRDEARLLLEHSVEQYDHVILLWEKMTPRQEPILKAIAQQAVVLFDLKLFDDALERADFCLERWPDLELARFARSLALLGTGRIRESAFELEKTLELFSKQNYRDAGAGIYEKLAEYYERQGNNARAFAALQRSFELMPSQQDNPAVFRALRAKEAEYRNLVTALEQNIAADPADGDSRLKLACAHAAFGNYAVAGPMFEDLLRPDQVGRDPIVLGPYALYFWQWRDTKAGYEQALSIYSEILARQPDREDIRAEMENCRNGLADLPKESK